MTLFATTQNLRKILLMVVAVTMNVLGICYLYPSFVLLVEVIILLFRLFVMFTPIGRKTDASIFGVRHQLFFYHKGHAKAYESVKSKLASRFLLYYSSNFRVTCNR